MVMDHLAEELILWTSTQKLIDCKYSEVSKYKLVLLEYLVEMFGANISDTKYTYKQNTFDLTAQYNAVELWGLLTSHFPGMLNQLKETFTHTPSYDMSPAMLSMLIRLMLAQAQECLFEKTALPGVRNQFNALMKMAQEAAKVHIRKDEVCPDGSF